MLIVEYYKICFHCSKNTIMQYIILYLAGEGQLNVPELLLFSYSLSCGNRKLFTAVQLMFIQIEQ